MIKTISIGSATMALLCAAAGGASGQPVQPVDVNVATNPLALDAPFFDVVGRAQNFRTFDTEKVYFWDHEFCLDLRDENTSATHFIVARESTTFTDDWQFGPTYTGLAVDWNASPRVRVIGVKYIDRIPKQFHDVPLDTNRTWTAFLLFVDQGGKWKEFYVNNWFHNWDPARRGLATPDIVQYYIDKGAPYDVYGDTSELDETVYSDNLREAVGQYKVRLFHGLLTSDAKAPQGYALHLLHWFGKGNWAEPAFGGRDTLGRFILKKQKWDRNI